MKPKDYFKDEWKEVFEIDSSSPSGLVWKVDGNNREIGRPVGWLDKSGYWRCEYNHKGTHVHRIIYHIAYGNLSTEFVVDHIDGNPLNNHPANLRMITKAQNSRNGKLRSTNTSGFTGVHESHVFLATWNEEGKKKTKSFNALVLGVEKAKHMAMEYRDSMLEKLNKKGYNYAESHGKRV